MKPVRCAIYTRKSSEEGLEQAFNSLDAQREACAAYILSQASEGWTALPEIYDDGGLSGGTLERPALQRLLAEVREGRVDIIVVYKVDRLTRSLLDFSKLVEAFDKAGTSFVSVTQSFNTTTSMGRLTLNMLLSFAQFEREVTAERIRDKIAASKAKGMWMGGIPPLGYAPNGRSLTIVPDHAEVVRDIFARYLQLGNVRLLAEQLQRDGVTAPRRTTATGKAMGGGYLTRGQLYLMLKCRTYLGEVEHKGQVYPGLHDGIVDRDLWMRVRDKLTENLQGKHRGTYAKSASVLAGLISDDQGEPLVPAHATKGKVRYRYYVSRALQAGESDTGMRIPAREIESTVFAQVQKLFDDPMALLGSAWLTLHAADYADATTRIQSISARLAQRDRALLRQIVTGVRVGRTGLEIDCSTSGISNAVGMPSEADAPPIITLTADVRLTRTGRAMRLVHDSGAIDALNPDRSMARLIVRAHRYWRELKAGDIEIKSLAVREGVSPSYVTRVLRLAFLAPKVTEAILAGRQRAGVDAAALVATNAVASKWTEQCNALLPDKTLSLP